MRSGAPTASVPTSGKVMALHLRWEEKGILAIGSSELPAWGK